METPVISKPKCGNCGAELPKPDGEYKCPYCGTVYNKGEQTAKEIAFEKFLQHAEEYLEKDDAKRQAAGEDLSEPDLRNVLHMKDYPDPASYYKAVAAQDVKTAKYGDIRSSLAPLYFFGPIIWFLWDIVGATLCKLFSWNVEPSFKPFFSPIFGHEWLVRFGIVFAFFFILFMVVDKFLRRKQLGY